MGIGANPNYLIDTAVAMFMGAFLALVTTVIIPYYAQGFFDESKWTLKRNLIWSGIMAVIFIVLGYIGLTLYYKKPLLWGTFLWFLVHELIILIPLALIVNLVNQYYLLKRHLKIAAGLNSIHHVGEQPNDKLAPLEFDVDKYTKVKIDVNQIVYAEALGNYITVVYDNQGIKKITIRESLGNLEQKIIHAKTMYRPHRSYLVNIGYILKVSGDAQGLKIHFRNMDNIVPVSRNKIKEFKGLISSKK
jgi:LytTr DNA-binding domain